MIVYGASLSPFTRKTLAFAAEKGIEVESRPVAPNDTNPEFVAASPFGKIPALRDGDFTLCDSSAIIAYLEAKQPQPVLIPVEAKARARTVWFEEFTDTILIPAVGKMFFNRIVAPRFFGREGDLAAADQAERKEVPAALDYLETQIPAGLHLVGSAVTLADIAVASPLVNLDHVGFQLDETRYPNIRAFKAAMLVRPSFAAMIEGEKRMLAA